MITIHRLDGTELVLNAELIENLEQKPDTIITLTNGKRLVARESLDEVRKLIIEYRRTVNNRKTEQGPVYKNRS